MSWKDIFFCVDIFDDVYRTALETCLR